MNRLKIFSIFFCLIEMFCINSCKNGTGHTKHGGSGNNAGSGSDGDANYRFGIQFSKGQEYYYNTKTTIQTSLEVDNKKTETSNQSEMGMFYEVLQDSGNIFSVKITYDKLHIVLKKTDTEDQVYDADNAAESFDQMDQLLSNIKGTSITVTLDSKGNIISTSGSKEIMNKVMGPMSSGDPQMKAKVQELVSRLTGPAFVDETLKESFKLFPDSGLYVGDSWKRQSTQSADMKFDVNSTYTLTSLDDGIAKIESEGKIANPKNTTATFMGYNVEGDLGGEQEGEFKADMESGLLLHGKTNISIKGYIRILGKNVPVKFRVKKEITAVKKS